MKYTEFNVNEKLFGKNYLIYKWEDLIDETHIYVKSQSRKGKCSQCGHESCDYHATYERTVQTIPFHGKRTFAHVIAYKFNCLNLECDQNVFMERLDFASPSQVRTTELTALILAVSIFLSNEGASKVLSLIGIKISNDTIKRIYDSITIEDDPNIEAVGIDDVAIRKGQSYATAIYDLKGHHLIALLDGRDAATLKEWLKEHKNIKLVVRDRASAYAKALNEILPDCVQVADRFHLLQNLIERMRDIFRDEIPDKIFIKNGEIMDSEPKKEQKLKIASDSDELNNYEYDNKAPVDENGNIINYDNKSHNPDKQEAKKHAEIRKEKQLLIHEVQKRWGELDKKTIKTIAKEFELSQPTAKKYIHMTEEEISALDNPTNYKKRKTVMDNYLNIIYKMLRDGIDPAIIMSYVIKQGYDGNLGTLKGYINLFAKNNFNIRLGRRWGHTFEYSDDVIIIQRRELLKYITAKNPKLKKDETIEQNLDIIKKKYKTVADLEIIYDEFYEILMGDNPDKLNNFIEKHEESKVVKFIEGIKKDIAPVKNAISQEESSGFVEGNNNKFKLLKRILYGRANLVNLFTKCYVAFKAKQEDFNVFELTNLDK